MEIYILIAVIIILCIIIFIALKKLIYGINEQNDAAYFKKMQDLDEKILQKQITLDSIDTSEEKRIKREKEIIVENKLDKELIDVFNSSDYENKDFLSLAKSIDDIFTVDSKEVILKFLENHKVNEDYETLEMMQARFSPNLIYKLKNLDTLNQIKEIKKLLSDKENVLFDKYVSSHKFKINNFLLDLEYEISNISPVIEVFTGNKNENYDDLSSYVKTIYDKKIYKGIIIKYQNRMYNYSLSERDGKK